MSAAGLALVAAASSSAPAVISAAGALVGVVLGGTISTGVESYRQRRRDLLLGRAARRLLADEMAAAAARMQDLPKSSVVYRDQLGVVVPSWEEYREFLAGRLLDADWDDMAVAVSDGRRTREALAVILDDASAAPVPLPLVDQTVVSAERLSAAAERIRETAAVPRAK